MYKRRPPKPIDYLDRVVPNSTKYSHIQGVLNTGVTIHKVKTVNAKEISKRRDEVFYRIGKHSLAELYSEYEMESHESITNPSLSYDPSAGGPKILTYDEGEIPRYEKPYLILDVREAMDYNKGHLLQSRSYPYAMMRRDYTHPELYNFRNKEGMLIIMYCDDEKISTEAAFVLVQRGYDNVYVLTGGLFEFANHYMSFIEGEVNMPKGSPSKPTRAPTARRSDLSTIRESSSAMTPMSSRLTSLRPSPSGLSQATLSSQSRHKYSDDRSESAMSTHSNMSVAETVISRAISRKGKL